MRRVFFSSNKDYDDNASLGNSTISTNFTRLPNATTISKRNRAVDAMSAVGEDHSVSQWTTATARTLSRTRGKTGFLWFCVAVYAVISLFSPSKMKLPKDLDEMANVVQASTDNAARGLTSLLLSRPTSPRKPVYLLGIFSTLTDEGRKRREFIRISYLQHPEVCSLYDFLKQKSTVCRVPYAFVVGGSPSRPVEHEPTDTEPLLVEASLLGVVESSDLICLNIKESDTDGKALSWMKFATTISQVDYIFKLVDDTVYFLDRIIPYLDESLDASPYNKRTYGGNMIDQPNECDKSNSEKNCDRSVGNPNNNKVGYYMTGPLYFLSRDLATLITADSTNRDPNQEYSIDGLAVSAFIHSNSEGVKLFRMSNPHILWYRSNRGDLASCWGKIRAGASGCTSGAIQ